MTPEVIGYVQELLLESGALDVWTVPVQMKKGRPGTVLSFLCAPADLERLAALVMAETGTLGLRYATLRRIVQSRRIEERETEFGPVRFKVTAFGEKARIRGLPPHRPGTGHPLPGRHAAFVVRGKTMKISTLSVGDELICGQITDTNAGTIAEALLNHGLRVQRHMTVGDSEPDIIEALLDLSRSSDAIIVTGGLGPTADDLTARAAARATGRRLVLNDHAKSHVRDMSGRLASLIVCPLNDKQAMIPAKTTLIPNPTGTACGFHLMNNGCFMFFLPGVPSRDDPDAA